MMRMLLVVASTLLFAGPSDCDDSGSNTPDYGVPRAAAPSPAVMPSPTSGQQEEGVVQIRFVAQISSECYFEDLTVNDPATPSRPSVNGVYPATPGTWNGSYVWKGANVTKPFVAPFTYTLTRPEPGYVRTYTIKLMFFDRNLGRCQFGGNGPTPFEDKQRVPETTSSTGGPIYIQFTANATCTEFAARDIQDTNTAVPNNASLGTYYGPSEPGSFAGAFSIGDASRAPFAYSITRPANGVRRKYTVLLVDFREHLGRCIIVAGEREIPAFVDEPI